MLRKTKIAGTHASFALYTTVPHDNYISSTTQKKGCVRGDNSLFGDADQIAKKNASSWKLIYLLAD